DSRHATPHRALGAARGAFYNNIFELSMILDSAKFQRLRSQKIGLSIGCVLLGFMQSDVKIAFVCLS
ncbi:hypothetical protein K0U00_42105, partial [Paenibacillus sepulcri]|nr:hypothetical protein [Paenibacillus sepulcri]